MALSDELRDLIEGLEKTVERLKKIEPEIVRLEEIAEKPKPDPLKIQFGSKIEAMRRVLLDEGHTLYIDEIVNILNERYGSEITRNTASGMLRRYSAEGKIFKAEGGNRFSLLEWSGKEKKPL